MLRRFRCPSCGANLNPAPEAARVTCEYCGTTAMVQRRGTTIAPEAPSMPVAVGTLPRWAYALYAVPLIGVLSSVGVSLYLGVTGGGGGVLSGIVQWSAHAPFGLRDVNGDGAADPIGWVRTFRAAGGEHSSHIAAYDGVSGARLWMTPPLFAVGEEHKALFGLAGDAVLVAGPDGSLHGFALADGAARWQINIGERATQICEQEDGAVLVTADEVSRAVSLVDGAFRPAEAPSPCLSLGGVEPAASSDRSRRRYSPSFTLGEQAAPPKGMSVREWLGASSVEVALGVKDPGTPVPMVAVYRDGRESWSRVVPEVDPLTVSEGPVNHAAIAGDALIMVYELSDSSADDRVIARALASGTLLWDQAIPRSGEAGSVQRVLADVESDRLYVAHWTYLQGFSLTTGEHKFTIGRWR